MNKRETHRNGRRIFFYDVLVQYEIKRRRLRRKWLALLSAGPKPAREQLPGAAATGSASWT